MNNHLFLSMISVCFLLAATSCNGQSRNNRGTISDTPNQAHVYPLLPRDTVVNGPGIVVPDTHENSPMPMVRPDSKQHNMPVVKPEPGVQPK